MVANRGRDTKPEQQIRSLLQRTGLRFRKHARPLKGLRCQADVLFPKEKVAVFIDGCFWHGCPQHGHAPRRNELYWADKIARNMARDQRNSEALDSAGWLALRYWEHEPPEKIASEIRDAVLRRRGQPRGPQ
jgi:DNA mismatch endonuclease (patch repair protein)